MADYFEKVIKDSKVFTFYDLTKIVKPNDDAAGSGSPSVTPFNNQLSGITKDSKKVGIKEKVEKPKLKAGAYDIDGNLLVEFTTDNFNDSSITTNTPWGININSIKKIITPYGLTEIADSIFRSWNLIEVIVQDGPTDLPRYFIAYSSTIQKVSFPNTLVNIKDFAFENCRQLKTIVYKDVEYTVLNELRAALLANEVNIGYSSFNNTGLL